MEQISVSGLCKSLLDAQKNLLQWSLCLDGVGHLEKVPALLARWFYLFLGFPGVFDEGQKPNVGLDGWNNVANAGVDWWHSVASGATAAACSNAGK